MNHAEFIEKNIKQVLIKEGYSIPIAQGGRKFWSGSLSTLLTGQREGKDVR